MNTFVSSASRRGHSLRAPVLWVSVRRVTPFLLTQDPYSDFKFSPIKSYEDLLLVSSIWEWPLNDSLFHVSCFIKPMLKTRIGMLKCSPVLMPIPEPQFNLIVIAPLKIGVIFNVKLIISYLNIWFIQIQPIIILNTSGSSLSRKKY